MSALSAFEAGYPPEQLAQEIDYSFLTIAMSVPTAIKDAAAGVHNTLHEEPGVGSLEAYPIGNFTLRVSMWFDETHRRSGLWKDFLLRDYYSTPGGRPILTAATDPGDLLGWPGKSLDDLAYYIAGLRDGYLKSLTGAEIIPIDDYGVNS